MNHVHCSHDRTFKSLMADPRVAKDFLKNYLSEKILTLVDLDNLLLEPNSFVDEEFNATYADVLFKTVISDNFGYLYLLCEHQSTSERKNIEQY